LSTAVVVVAITLLCGIGSAPRTAVPPAPAATPTAPAATSTVHAAAPAQLAPKAPVKYSLPVGGYYLTQFNDRFGRSGDGPPALFLVGDAELAGARLGWVMPKLADSLINELVAVLDDACQGRGCAAAVEAARTRVHEIGEWRSYGPAHAHHWTDMSEMPPVEHRSVAIRSAGAVTVEAVCTCQSWTIGMRMWNDEIDCVTTVRDHGRFVIRYAPKVLRGYGKEVESFNLDAYDQVASFPSGDDLVIESGFEYEHGSDARPVKTRQVRRGVRWKTHAGPR
jgi:hypothetical protein